MRIKQQKQPKPFFLLFCVLAMALPNLSNAQTRVLTLREAYEIASAQSPVIISAKETKNAAKEREGAAFSGFLPSVNIDGSYTRQTGNYVSRPGATLSSSQYTPPEPSNDSYNYFSAGVSLKQVIYDFNRTFGAYKAAGASADAAGYDLTTAKLTTWLSVTERYYGVLVAQELVEVASRNRDQSRRYADRAKAQFESGLRPRIDVVRTEADAQNAESNLLSAQDALSVAKSALLAAIGAEKTFDFRVEPPKEDPSIEIAPPFDGALSEALGARPERKAFLKRIDAQIAQLRSINGNYFPQFILTGSFTDAGIEISDLAWNWSVTAGISYPIFSGFSTMHQEREAEANLAASYASLKNMELGVRAELEQAFAKFTDAKARIAPSLAALSAAQEAQSLAEGRYDTGAGNQVELLDAQAAYANAQAALIRVRYDVAVSWAGLQKALGRIPAPFNSETDS